MPRKRGKHYHYDFTIKGVRYRGPLPVARTKTDAEKEEWKVKLSVLDGSFKQPNPATLAEFIDAVFWPWAETNYVNPKLSHVHHTQAVKKALGHLALEDISPIHIERFKRDRLVEKTNRGGERKPATVNRDLQALTRILQMAVDNGLIKENPARKVKLLRQDNQRTRYLTDEEEVCVLNLLDTFYRDFKPVVVFALSTGMRRGEIVRLDWSDVDFARGVIYVKKTKTGKTRAVPINAEVARVFEDLGPKKDGKVFKHAAQSVSDNWRWITDRLKLPNVTFHDLRHTFATRLLDAGVDPFTIAELLGHTDIKMTRRYTHTLEVNKRRAVEALSRRANVIEMSQIGHSREEQATGTEGSKAVKADQ